MSAILIITLTGDATFPVFHVYFAEMSNSQGVVGVDWFFFPVALIINEFLNAHQNAFLSRPTAADLNQLNVRASVLPLKQLSADDDTGLLISQPCCLQ